MVKKISYEDFRNIYINVNQTPPNISKVGYSILKQFGLFYQRQLSQKFPQLASLYDTVTKRCNELTSQGISPLVSQIQQNTVQQSSLTPEEILINQLDQILHFAEMPAPMGEEVRIRSGNNWNPKERLDNFLKLIFKETLTESDMVFRLMQEPSSIPANQIIPLEQIFFARAGLVRRGGNVNWLTLIREYYGAKGVDLPSLFKPILALSDKFNWGEPPVQLRTTNLFKGSFQEYVIEQSVLAIQEKIFPKFDFPDSFKHSLETTFRQNELARQKIVYFVHAESCPLFDGEQDENHLLRALQVCLIISRKARTPRLLTWLNASNEHHMKKLYNALKSNTTPVGNLKAALAFLESWNQDNAMHLTNPDCISALAEMVKLSDVPSFVHYINTLTNPREVTKQKWLLGLCTNSTHLKADKTMGALRRNTQVEKHEEAIFFFLNTNDEIREKFNSITASPLNTGAAIEWVSRLLNEKKINIDQAAPLLANLLTLNNVPLFISRHPNDDFKSIHAELNNSRYLKIDQALFVLQEKTGYNEQVLLDWLLKADSVDDISRLCTITATNALAGITFVASCLSQQMIKPEKAIYLLYHALGSERTQEVLEFASKIKDFFSPDIEFLIVLLQERDFPLSEATLSRYTQIQQELKLPLMPYRFWISIALLKVNPGVFSQRIETFKTTYPLNSNPKVEDLAPFLLKCLEGQEFLSLQTALAQAFPSYTFSTDDVMAIFAHGTYTAPKASKGDKRNLVKQMQQKYDFSNREAAILFFEPISDSDKEFLEALEAFCNLQIPKQIAFAILCFHPEPIRIDRTTDATYSQLIEILTDIRTNLVTHSNAFVLPQANLRALRDWISKFNDITSLRNQRASDIWPNAILSIQNFLYYAAAAPTSEHWAVGITDSPILKIGEEQFPIASLIPLPSLFVHHNFILPKAIHNSPSYRLNLIGTDQTTHTISIELGVSLDSINHQAGILSLFQQAAMHMGAEKVENPNKDAPQSESLEEFLPLYPSFKKMWDDFEVAKGQTFNKSTLGNYIFTFVKALKLHVRHALWDLADAKKSQPFLYPQGTTLAWGNENTIPLNHDSISFLTKKIPIVGDWNIRLRGTDYFRAQINDHQVTLSYRQSSLVLNYTNIPKNSCSKWLQWQLAMVIAMADMM